MSDVVCLLTDFGLQDHYVGVMKGVLLANAPGVQIVDVNHNIPPQDVRFAAFEIMASGLFYPKGTLFICTVGPGTKETQRIIYSEAAGRRFITPDNGLLSWLMQGSVPELIVDISNVSGLPKSSESTFHGRDIMAPVAGKILKGADPRTLGPSIKDYVKLPFPEVKKLGSLWTGEIIAVDTYGNLVTNIKTEDVAALAEASKLWFEFKNQESTVRGLADNYSNAEKGKLLALKGSSGFIEISMRDGSAAQKTGLKSGDPVKLYFRT